MCIFDAVCAKQKRAQHLAAPAEVKKVYGYAFSM